MKGSFGDNLLVAIPSALVFIVVFVLVDHVLFTDDAGLRFLGEIAALILGIATGVILRRSLAARG